MVVKAGTAATMQCTHTAVKGPVAVHWMVQLPGSDHWKLVLMASDSTGFSGASLKASMQLVDANFRDTGVFSLSLQAEREDSGFYHCLIEQQQRRLKERIILLAILTGSQISALLHQKRPGTVPSPHDLTVNVCPLLSPVTVLPTGPIPQGSTLQLVASVHPDFAASKIHWVKPAAVFMRSETVPKAGTVAKMPQVQLSDKGPYICMVHPSGNSSSGLFAFNIDVSVDGEADWSGLIQWENVLLLLFC